MSGNRRLTDTPAKFPEKAKKLAKKRFPILTWLPKYKKGYLAGDIVSGITVGLTVVPQSMAYAGIAGLTPQYGLYSSYIGCLVYIILGSCRQVTIGPTAVMGLLTFETCGENFPQCAILTGFYAGVFELLMGICQFGGVVSFISEPVTSAFTSGAAITIISSQIKNLLGLSGKKGNSFMQYWKSIFANITTARTPDYIMGIVSVVALIALKQLTNYKASDTPKGRIIKKSLWLTSVSRNALMVIITTLIARFWTSAEFKLTGEVLGGFPPIGLPDFQLPTNATSEEYHTFLDTWHVIGFGPLIIALISVLQNVAISKAFGSGQTVDATQEMYALGTASVVSSFFSSIPISGSFSRSAVNEASGVRSPLGGLVTGSLVLVSLAFLTPYFYYIPQSGLAAVIITAVMPMIEFEALPTMWKICKLDVFCYLFTFLGSVLLGMEYGIMIGVGISLIFLLGKFRKPVLNSELKTDPVTSIKYQLIKPSSGLSFPSVDYIRKSIMKLARKNKDVFVIVINFQKCTTFDYTVVTAFSSLVKNLKKTNQTLVFIECNKALIDAFKLENSEFPILSYDELSDYLGKSMSNGLEIKTNDRSIQIETIEPSQNGNHHLSSGENNEGMKPLL